MTNWEYKTVELKQKSSFWSLTSDFQNTSVIETALNTLGLQGWELVSGVPNSEYYGKTSKVLLIFKRPIVNS